MVSEALPARVMKAITLADYLDGAGIRSRRAARMELTQWAMLAQAAAVHEPSDETRALTLSLLRTREDVRKQFACLRRRQRTRSTETGPAKPAIARIHVIKAGEEGRRP